MEAIAAITGTIVEAIIEGGRLSYKDIKRSHRTLYEAITQVMTLGYTVDNVIAITEGWTNSAEWLDLKDTEYLADLYKISEHLVNWETFIKSKAFNDTMKRPLTPAKLRLMDFLLTTKPAVYIAGANADKVEVIHRILGKHNMLINVHTAATAGLMEVKPIDCRVYSHDMFPYAAATQAVANIEEAIANINAFACGMLQKSPNPDFKGEFPWDNVAVAGGCVLKSLMPDCSPDSAPWADVDIFVHARTLEARQTTYRTLLEWFHTPKTWYGVCGAVTSVYIRDVPRKFQIVSSDAASAFSIISEFDLTHIQLCYIRGTFYGSPSAILDVPMRKTRIVNPNGYERVLKAMRDGFAPARHDPEIPEIDTLLADNTRVEKILCSMLAYTNITTNCNLNQRMQDLSDKGIISSLGNYVAITNSCTDVMARATLGQCIRDAYYATSVADFSVDKLAIPARPSYNAKLSFGYGRARFVTGKLTVQAVNQVGNSKTCITVALDRECKDFVEKIYSNVYRRYYGEPYRVASTESAVFKVIQARESHRVVLKSQSGEPLVVEESLHTGDTITITFGVGMHRHGADRVEFLVCSMVKYSEIAVETLEPVADNTRTDVQNDLDYDD